MDGDEVALRALIAGCLVAPGDTALDDEALRRAAYVGESTVAMLIDAGADVDLPDLRNETALHWAARPIAHVGAPVAVERVKVLAARQILQESDESIDRPGEFGRTPLYYAAAGGYRDLVRLLLDAGADPNLATVDGRTPLMEAAGGGDRPMAERLIAAGADSAREDSAGRTAAELAELNGHPDVAAWLRSL